MVDITTIPEEELRNDLAESIMDLLTCRRVDPQRFEKRIAGNQKIIAAIQAELVRRGLPVDQV